MALADQGVNSFDLDLMFASDASIGEIYAAHPVAMKTWLDLPDAQAARVAQLQRAAATRADGHPILTASRLLTLVAQHNWTVALDLKGGERQPERHAEQLLWLAERIQATQGLAQRAWLYVETSEGARWLRRRLRLSSAAAGLRDASASMAGQSARSLLTLIKPIRDRGVPPPPGGAEYNCAPSQLQRADAALFDRLGPSAKCANPNLIGSAWARTRWTARDSLLVWVVDDAPTLEMLLRFGVSHAISNRPLHVRSLARALCRRAAPSSGGVEEALNCADRGSHTCTV